MNTQGGRTLVTGGTGFFGRLLVRDLLTHTRLDITPASRGKPSKESLRSKLGSGATQRGPSSITHQHGG
jgi:thioester reductase-like protein